MKCFTIWQDNDHRWLAFAQDPERPDNVIDTNQLVVTSEDATMMLDPGGVELFPAMAAAVTQEVAVDRLRHLFLSHQDPDVASSLPLWRQLCGEGMAVHVSWMWTGFLSHFDSTTRFEPIPDHGCEVHLSKSVRLHLLPAHYLHSSGCFNVYDPRAKVLFTGDIGAAILPREALTDIWVADFDAHIRYMEAFHRRWLGSREARDRWVAMVRRLDVEVLAPQHGLFFRGPDVTRFLDWLADLPIASGLDAFDQVAV